MSYDINFWKQTRPLELSAQEIYEKLSGGEHDIDGLAELPVEQIQRRIKEAFPDYDPQEDFPLIETEHSGIEVSHSRHHFRFDLRGEIGEVHNRLVEIMADFGCPMYDPQRGERYEAEGGTAVGDWPRFTDTTDEQRRQLEELKQQMLRNIQAGGRRKGCGTTAAICLLLCAGCVMVFRALVSSPNAAKSEEFAHVVGELLRCSRGSPSDESRELPDKTLAFPRALCYIPGIKRFPVSYRGIS